MRSIAILDCNIHSQITVAHVTLPKAVPSTVEIFAVYRTQILKAHKAYKWGYICFLALCNHLELYVTQAMQCRMLSSEVLGGKTLFLALSHRGTLKRMDGRQHTIG